MCFDRSDTVRGVISIHVTRKDSIMIDPMTIPAGSDTELLEKINEIIAVVNMLLEESS